MLKPLLLILVCATFGSGAHAKDDRVCSSSACIEGETRSLVFGHSKNIALLPGVYAPSSPVATINSLDSIHQSLTFPPDIYLSSTYNASTSLTVLPPDTGLLYSDPIYAGQRLPMGQMWQSLFIPSSSYANLGAGKVLWNAVPDGNQLPSSVHGRKVIAFGSTGCQPICSSHGTCVSATAGDSTHGTCQCVSGWTGVQCDICSTGYFGPSCKPCTDDCTVCDDGLSGSGLCLGTKSGPVKSCMCAHGTCSSSGDSCTCAAGWKTDSNDFLKCSRCTDGYAVDSKGECSVCPAGCTVCGIASDTSNSTVCTKCIEGYTLSSSGTCVNAHTACSPGQYYNNATSTCTSCSPACATCTGGGSTECLTCNAPRFNFMGSCVGYSFSDGVCETGLSGAQGVFVADNERQACNSCPVGCTACAIPEFSTGSKISDAKCSSCQQGYLLEEGKCVQQCSPGRFAPKDTAMNGTCQACDASICGECVSTGTTCTRCTATDLFANNGQCTQSCPTGFFPSNSTCVACDADCASCDGNGSCATCPLGRPVLLNGQCVPSCPSTQYYDATSSSCIACDAGCLTCAGAGDQQCTSCADGSVLRGGQCQAADCEADAFASGFGACLAAFTIKPGKLWWPYLLLALSLVSAIAGGAWTYIRKQRIKQRARVQEFGEALDDVTIFRRLQVLRLERVLGLQRALEPEESKGPKGLKTLRLPLFAQWRRNDEVISKRRSGVEAPPPYVAAGASHSRTSLLQSKQEEYMMEEPRRPTSAVLPAPSSLDVRDKPINNPFRAL